MQKIPAEQEQIPGSDTTQSSRHEIDFQLERYKYILGEIRSLNDNIHKYLTLFQTLAVTITGSGIGIFIVWKSLRIDATTARVAIQGALGLLILLALFITVSLVATLFSWFDYRQEEVDLLEKAVKPGFRKPPTFRNFWRWPETYVLFFINIAIIIIYLYVEYQILPLVN